MQAKPLVVNVKSQRKFYVMKFSNAFCIFPRKVFIKYRTGSGLDWIKNLGLDLELGLDLDLELEFAAL